MLHYDLKHAKEVNRLLDNCKKCNEELNKNYSDECFTLLKIYYAHAQIELLKVKNKLVKTVLKRKVDEINYEVVYWETLRKSAEKIMQIFESDSDKETLVA